MGLPKKIRQLSGMTWTIRTDQYERLAQMDRLGEMDEAALEIHIGRAKLPQIQKTLIHEMLHAISGDIFGGTSQNLSEEQVRVISSALLVVLQANPSMVAYLMTREKDTRHK